MHRHRLIAAAVLAAWTGVAVAGQQLLPRGDEAYKTFPAIQDGQESDYLIGPLDTLAVTVLQEPDLSGQEIQVDANGNIALPLLGAVSAGNKTPAKLAAEISQRFSEKYLNDPQVTVRVVKAASQQVTVEGSVTEPGIYPLSGRTSLVDAVAMAKGPTRVASLSHVAVFREIGGKRYGALFDLSKIRKGEAPDPEIHGRDRVVVGVSGGKTAWRDFLSATGTLGRFVPYY